MTGLTDDRRTKILIVEDEVIISADLQSRVEQLGYNVCGSVVTGEQAIDFVRRQKVDLVLMDIVLGGPMDGVAAADQVRTQGVPVVFLTAFAEQDRIEKAKLALPFGYLIKPFQDRDLRVTIEMALYTAKMDLERRRIEQIVRDSEAQFRDLAANLPGAVFRYLVHKDMTSKLVYISDNVSTYFGVTPGETMADPRAILKQIHPDDRDSVFNKVRESNRTVSSFIDEHRVVSKRSGETRWLWVSAIPRRIETADILWNGLVLDITERKETEARLRNSEKLYRTLIETSPEAIVVTDMRAWLILTNDQALKLYGYADVDEARRLRPSTLEGVAPQDRDRFVLDQIAAFQNGHVMRHTYTLLKKDGAPFLGEVSSSFFTDDHGEPIGAISIIREIPDRR